MIKHPLLITGATRSGTSMIAAAINLCGAFGGYMSKGTFENTRIRNAIVRSYLSRIEVDPLGQYPLPDTKNIHLPKDWKQQVEYVILKEGYVGGAWMYKDARISLMWPVWYQAYPHSKCVIVRRKTSDIIRSCTKTGYMIAFKDQANCQSVSASTEEEGWLWWVHQYEQRFVEMITGGMDCKIIWPERMVNGDYTQLRELLEWLNLPWKEEALGFINSLLWGKNVNQNKERRTA